MRQIGTINDASRAQQFAAYLISRGTACSVDASPNGIVVWVQDEDRVAVAREQLQQFLAEPDHERYRDAPRQAAAVVRETQQQQAAIKRRTIKVRDRWTRPTIEHCPATFGLMSLMVLVAIVTGLAPEKHEDLFLKLVFSTDETLRPILSGEVWRLVSPIFLHFGFMHFLFNLLYLRDFGMLVEYRIGTPKYLGMILVMAIVSNYAQFAMVGSMFGGMSGVNYGLFGYIWVRSRLDPNCGYWMPSQTVTIMIGWHILCVLGVVPHVANWAHGGGLVAGVVMGASVPLWKSFTGRS
jgi:GlpG protein